MLRILTAAAIFVLSAAHAQLPDKVAREVIDDFGTDTLAPILRNAGLTPEVVTLAGRETLVVRSSDIVALLRPRVCEPKCTGLLMYAVFDGSASAQLMNDYNRQTPAASVFTEGGNTIVSRYLIADYGTTVGSFLVNLAVFDNTARKWSQMRSSTNSIAVSLNDRTLETNLTNEEREFIDGVMGRSELFSATAETDY